MFTKGGRHDLAEQETREIAVLESYLPASAGAEEMDRAIEAAMAETGANSAKQMGRRHQGRTSAPGRAKRWMARF